MPILPYSIPRTATEAFGANTITTVRAYGEAQYRAVFSGWLATRDASRQWYVDWLLSASVYSLSLDEIGMRKAIQAHRAKYPNDLFLGVGGGGIQYLAMYSGARPPLREEAMGTVAEYLAWRKIPELEVTRQRDMAWTLQQWSPHHFFAEEAFGWFGKRAPHGDPAFDYLSTLSTWGPAQNDPTETSRIMGTTKLEPVLVNSPEYGQKTTLLSSVRLWALKNGRGNDELAKKYIGDHWHEMGWLDSIVIGLIGAATAAGFAAFGAAAASAITGGGAAAGGGTVAAAGTTAAAPVASSVLTLPSLGSLVTPLAAGAVATGGKLLNDAISSIGQEAPAPLVGPPRPPAQPIQPAAQGPDWLPYAAFALLFL